MFLATIIFLIIILIGVVYHYETETSMLVKSKAKQEDRYSDMYELYNATTNKNYVLEKNVASLNQKIETLTEINQELISKLNSQKDEQIKVTVTGEDSVVNITDVDGIKTTRRKKRTPGTKRPYYKKKSKPGKE